jgi:hypothetical protein
LPIVYPFSIPFFSRECVMFPVAGTVPSAGRLAGARDAIERAWVPSQETRGVLHRGVPGRQPKRVCARPMGTRQAGCGRADDIIQLNARLGPLMRLVRRASANVVVTVLGTPGCSVREGGRGRIAHHGEGGNASGDAADAAPACKGLRGRQEREHHGS